MMIRPLPDTDLARIAPQPSELKRKSLEQIRGGRPPFSFRPVRSCYNDIFNMQPDLDFGAAPPTPWEKIEADLTRRCKTQIELDHNKLVARSLHDFATSGRVICRKHDFFPLSMGSGKKVSYWLPMIAAIDEQPTALFIEPRRNRGLSAEGRRFVFSMMHERIRVADEDFAEVNLSIIRFDPPNDGYRSTRIYTDKGVDLYSLSELEAMVSSTYEMWHEVCEEREREARSKPTGTEGWF